MTETDRHSKFLNDLWHCLLLSQTTVMYSDVRTSTCPRLHVVARLCRAAIVTLCYSSIIPNMPLSPAVPLLLCWMLRAGLALSKCYLEPDSYSPFHAIYDGLCCVVVNSGVMSGTLHKRTSSSNFTWCGHREGYQLCLLAAKPHIL